MKKIRVLHILDELNTGGAEQIVYTYFLNIDKNKYQWDFVVMNIPDKPEGRLESKVKERGAVVYKVTKKKESLRKNINEIDKIIRHGRYDIVHSHLYEVSAFYLFSAWKYKVPVRIAHSHAAGERRGWRADLLRLCLKPLLYCVTNGKAACGKKAAISLWGHCSGVKIINNAINVDDFKYNEYFRSELRKELLISESTTVIGTVGRMCYQKNSEFIIDIFYEYKKLNVNSKLLFIGEGENEESVKKRVEKYNLNSDVIFFGRRNDVNKLMNIMDCFLLPSRYEGLPIVAIEAQCNGLSCFVSDSVTSEICLSNNVNMISISKSASYWAENIFDFLKQNIFNRELGEKIVIDAGYEIQSQTRLLLNYYESLLNKY